MGRGKNYTNEYKEMISDLYSSGISFAEISSEYGIVKLIINGWIKDSKKVKISDEEFMTTKGVDMLKKEIAKIKEENEILKKAIAIFAKEK